MDVSTDASTGSRDSDRPCVCLLVSSSQPESWLHLSPNGAGSADVEALCRPWPFFKYNSHGVLVAPCALSMSCEQVIKWMLKSIAMAFQTLHALLRVG